MLWSNLSFEDEISNQILINDLLSFAKKKSSVIVKKEKTFLPQQKHTVTYKVTGTDKVESGLPYKIWPHMVKPST